MQWRNKDTRERWAFAIDKERFKEKAEGKVEKKEEKEEND